MKKFIALLLSVAMVVGLFPTMTLTAYAAPVVGTADQGSAPQVYAESTEIMTSVSVGLYKFVPENAAVYTISTSDSAKKPGSSTFARIWGNNTIIAEDTNDDYMGHVTLTAPLAKDTVYYIEVQNLEANNIPCMLNISQANTGAPDFTATIKTSDQWSKGLDVIFDGLDIDLENFYLKSLTAEDGGDSASASVFVNGGVNNYDHKILSCGHDGNIAGDSTITLGFEASTSGTYLFIITIDGGASRTVKITVTGASAAPTATTTAASSISSTAATLNGTVNANNASTVVTFEYGTTTGYGSTVTAAPSPVTGTSNTSVSGSISELKPNTTYHYRVVATNATDITNGGDQTFTTSVTAPTAATDAASDISSTAATLNGTVNANNASTTVTFEYGITTGYGSTVTASQSPITGTSNTSVSGSLSGLKPNMTYHYRVVATNATGITNGGDQTFTTSAIAPTVTTDVANGISSTALALSGIVNANNTSTTVTFEYGTTTGYGSTVAAAPNPVTGTSNISVTGSLWGLKPNTTYHYRVVGTNAVGITNGGDQTFTTSAIAPTVTTDVANGISSTAATLNGTVNANNASTTVTFEYGTTTGYGSTVTAVPSPITGTSNTSVNYALSGLEPNTTYHYRVVARNTAGAAQGADQTFKTPPVTASVSSVDAINGALTIVLDKVPTTAPVAADFTATSRIDGELAKNLPLSSFAWNAETKTVTFHFAEITQIELSQSVKVAVTYNSVTTEAPAFTVSAAWITATVASVAATNGAITVTLDKVPSEAPTASDFTATSSVNSGESNSLPLSGFSWNASTRTITFHFTPIETAASAQSVVIAVAYKSAAPVSAEAFTVEAAPTADKTLISITAPEAIAGIANGTAKTAAALGLPETVELVTNGGTVSATVRWDIVGCDYIKSKTTEQTFTVHGIITLPAGVVNTNNVKLKTTIDVTVNAASGGDPVTKAITGFLMDYTTKTVPYGTGFASLNLPDKIKAVGAEISNLWITVTDWVCSTYKPNVPGTYTLTAVLDSGYVDSGYVLGDGVKAPEIKVTIKEKSSNNNSSSSSTPSSSTTNTEKTETKVDTSSNTATVTTKPDSVNTSGSTTNIEATVPSVTVDNTPTSTNGSMVDTSKKATVTINVPTETIVQQLTAKKDVDLTVTVPSGVAKNTIEGVAVTINASKQILEAAKQSLTDVTIKIKDADTQQLAYSWTFKGEDLAKSTVPVSDVNIAMSVHLTTEVPKVNVITPANKGLVLSFDHSGVLPSVANVKFSAKEKGFLPGQTLYFYFYNPVTKQMESLGNDAYTVDADGNVTVQISHCSDYVLLPKAARTITLDTRTYTMRPKKSYEIGVRLTGVSNPIIKAYSSTKGAANVTVLTNGNVKATGLKPGVTYIMIDVYDNKNKFLTHASVRLTVQNGVKENGNSARQHGLF